jgi:epoxyqueuosine reductase
MAPAPTADLLRGWALAAGFDRAGIARLDPSEHGAAFRLWLERGEHAGMGWLERRSEERLDSGRLLPGGRTALCVALRYWPLAGEEEPSGDLWPRVARYARGSDYHALMERRLDGLAERIAGAFPGVLTRRYVDTGPLLERELAARAGLGAVGKNTCLLERDLGSWFLLGELLLTLELPADEPLADLCGACTLCLDSCPTDALVEPRRLDSNRCISYWTIEHRGPMPEAARHWVGDWVFGCDLCQEVCPWNRRRSAAPPADHPELGLPAERRELDLAGLLGSSEEDYVARFRGSPMKRAKHAGLRRNAAVAMGNRGETHHVAPLTAALAGDPDPVVRGHAAWALGRIGGDQALAALAAALRGERDDTVRDEAAAAWRSAAASRGEAAPSAQTPPAPAV